MATEQTAREIIGFYRGLVLDGIEAEIGEEPSWKYIRGRVLKAFGESGLEGKIVALIKNNQTEGTNDGRQR